MSIRFLVLLALLVPIAWAGDEFQTPTLREGSSYESVTPKYWAVGMEDRESEHRLWVVAEPDVVLTQKGVNVIIKDVQHRNLGPTEIRFYTSVRNEPQFPAFRITDDLAVYRPRDNKIYYSVAAKHLYGGWAHGPRK